MRITNVSDRLFVSHFARNRAMTVNMIRFSFIILKNRKKIVYTDFVSESYERPRLFGVTLRYFYKKLRPLVGDSGPVQ